MVRVGINPAKLVQNLTFNNPLITVCFINHITVTEGYWKESLNILKVCLDSLISNTKIPIKMFVLDNTSCSAAKEYPLDLLRNDQIQL